MQVKVHSLSEKLMYVLILIYFSSSYILITFTWGKYVMLLTVFGILFIHAANNGWKIRFPQSAFYKRMLPFVLFCFMSLIWAWDINSGLSKCITIAEIMVFMWIINASISSEFGVSQLLKVIMFGAYIECAFLCVYFGFSTLMNFTNMRLTNEVGNSNFISMLMTIGIIITLYEIIFEGFRWYHLCGIFLLYILAIGQSRTALIGAVVGVVMIGYFKAIDTKNKRNVFFRILGVLIVIALLFYFLSQLSIFEPINMRMQNLIVSITGRGTILNGERSVSIRREMINIGVEQFVKSPLLGIGIGNGFNLVEQTIGASTYLHNNYIELLVDTGLIGFVFYYSVYAYLLINFYKLKHYKNKVYFVCITLLIIQLVMDYGAVSYYAKDTYFYFMLYFIELSLLKRNKLHNTL